MSATKWIIVAACLFGSTTAFAATVGTGFLSDTVDLNSSSFSGSVTLDDMSFDLFGTPVNLGTAVGTATFAGTFNLSTALFTGHVAGTTPGTYDADVMGSFTNANAPGTIAFIGTYSNFTGSVPATFPPGLSYTFDGTVTFIGGFVNGVGTQQGSIALNAFQPEATPLSPAGCAGSDCNVSVTIPPTTITNSATGQQVPIEVTVTFPNVTASGTTQATAVSFVAGQLAPNFTFNSGATFVDVSTTATVDTSGGPITLCFDYAIAGSTSDPSVLRLMHLENGMWVDVTTSVDTTTQVICGAVSSLSPFGVATSTFACSSAPVTGCQSAAAQKAQVVLGDGKFSWKWTSSGTVALSDFGSPPTTTDYLLCVYGGVNLHLPTLPLTTPVLVQLRQSSSSTCWDATYSSATTNTPSTFKAKSD